MSEEKPTFPLRRLLLLVPFLGFAGLAILFFSRIEKGDARTKDLDLVLEIMMNFLQENINSITFMLKPIKNKTLNI